MPIFLNALLCGIVGAIGAHMAYVQSNLLILGDTIRRGRHPLFDPLFFDGAGLVWGLLICAACAAWLRHAGPVKATLLGLGVTVAGIIAVGGGLTAQRYVEIPRVPMIDGKDLWLAFELRLPHDRAGTAGSLQRGELRARGQGTDIVNAFLQPDKMVAQDGRVTIPGSAELRRSVRDRQLDIFDGNVPWPSFVLTLPANPTKTDMEWTSWFPADGGGNSQDQQRARGYQIRYRVVTDDY